MRSHPLVLLSRVKFLEFVREPEAIFWVLVFPVLLSSLWASRFGEVPEPLAVAVCEAGRRRRARRSARTPPSPGLAERRTGEFARREGRPRRDPGDADYWFDPARDESRVAGSPPTPRCGPRAGWTCAQPKFMR